jgi:multidrug efflux pump
MKFILRDMAITVRADVKYGEQGVSVTQSIRPLLKDIEAKLPSARNKILHRRAMRSLSASSATPALLPPAPYRDPR